MTWRILVGNVVDKLREFPDNYFHCVVTSPPYWALRDYGTGWWEGGDSSCEHTQKRAMGPQTIAKGSHSADGKYFAGHGACTKCGAVRKSLQIGMEPTMEEFLVRLVEVFREVKRVLRPDGVCWINHGDNYQDKQLVGQAFDLARALKGDEWYLRSVCIWHKPNPLPESVTDRPAVSHEYVFMMTKSPRYFYDAAAVRTKYSPVSEGQDGYEGQSRKPASFKVQNPSDTKRRIAETMLERGGANLKSVWSIPPQPTPEAHFATFPERLVETCVLAGTSERGCCAKCGAPWRRVEVAEGGSIGQGWHDHGADGEQGQAQCGSLQGAGDYARRTAGWEPTCECAAESVPCRVLDPFSGSGTTVAVSLRLGRDGYGTELNPEYAAMTVRRLEKLSPTLARSGEVVS